MEPKSYYNDYSSISELLPTLQQKYYSTYSLLLTETWNNPTSQLTNNEQTLYRPKSKNKVLWPLAWTNTVFHCFSLTRANVVDKLNRLEQVASDERQ